MSISKFRRTRQTSGTKLMKFSGALLFLLELLASEKHASNTQQ
jgi:hypothetical protein